MFRKLVIAVSLTVIAVAANSRTAVAGGFCGGTASTCTGSCLGDLYAFCQQLQPNCVVDVNDSICAGPNYSICGGQAWVDCAYEAVK